MIIISNIQLYNGDCFDVMKTLKDKSVDFILCDLPYGVTRCKWDIVIPFDKLWEQYNRIVKDNGIIALFGTEPFASHLRMSNIKNYKYDLYWDKCVPGGIGFAKYQPMRKIETISIFYKKRGTFNAQKIKRDKIRIDDRKYQVPSDSAYITSMSMKKPYKSIYEYKNPTNLLKFRKVHGRGTLHPTQKPVDLLEYLIKTYTDENDLVLDNCMGSGSTGVACKNLNRSFIGIELDKDYFNIAKQRIGE